MRYGSQCQGRWTVLLERLVQAMLGIVGRFLVCWFDGLFISLHTRILEMVRFARISVYF